MYVVECSDASRSLYCGISNDVAKRVKTHNAGKGAKYTRGRTPVRLLATWPYPDRSTASSAEYQFKKLSRVEKCAFIKKPETWNADKHR